MVPESANDPKVAANPASTPQPEFAVPLKIAADEAKAAEPPL